MPIIVLVTIAVVFSVAPAHANSCMGLFDKRPIPFHIRQVADLNVQSKRLLESAFAIREYDRLSPIYAFRGGRLAIYANGKSAQVFVPNGIPRAELETYAFENGLSIQYHDIHRSQRTMTPLDEMVSARQFFMTMKTVEQVDAFILWVANSRLAYDAPRAPSTPLDDPRSRRQ